MDPQFQTSMDYIHDEPLRRHHYMTESTYESQQRRQESSIVW
eukprot:CAMPEP_0194034260 /NCGR_PEP_ID=MMETSP0009_2-20130614/6665_1 /TAXON_ID=210454 /ORGANISM="Grammatophora oceanica, Strain CCMP 410" /LENGTH=41 /DNA_ID= /DNA_START= /DNA_END= /DNA_ORIENTATION=